MKVTNTGTTLQRPPRLVLQRFEWRASNREIVGALIIRMGLWGSLIIIIV